MYKKIVFFGFLKNFEICLTSDRFIGIQRSVFDQFFEHQMALKSKSSENFLIKQRLQ